MKAKFHIPYRLAERSLRFDRAYCQFPVCNSSRASFLTGLRPPTTGVIQNDNVDYLLDEDVVTLPQAFRDNGYYTVSIGKVFHKNDGDGRSWDEDWEFVKGYVDPTNYTKLSQAELDADTHFYRINEKKWEFLYKGPEDLESYGYTDHRVATDVESFLDEAAANASKKPFFLVAGYKKPHNPYIGPSSYFDLYPPETLHLRGERHCQPAIQHRNRSLSLHRVCRSRSDTVRALRSQHRSGGVFQSRLRYVTGGYPSICICEHCRGDGNPQGVAEQPQFVVAANLCNWSEK